MPDYDFHTLSYVDFQVLTRDLLQEALGVRFQAFKAGKDQGIDLLHEVGRGRRIVVQCKHFGGSTFRSLLTSLKKELPELNRINPTRYILSVSLPLSLKNKEAVIELLNPFIKSSQDIFGRDELNGLLAQYPKVEESHFKLWISSTTVLNQIIHSKTVNVTNFALEKIIRRIPLYVSNKSFDEARLILERSHSCIIAGIPGIGKTTLAEILIMHYLRDDYQLVKVTSNIDEAMGIGRQHDKQVFYYDDFLGQTSFEEKIGKLGKNEEQDLIDFMEHIQRSPTKRFILTTREYILNQARAHYEKLHRDFEIEKCIIDLESYTRLNRAQILYNHVFFSKLSAKYKRDLLKEDRYLSIIDHPNYNPRIMEMMTIRFKESSLRSRTYYKSFKIALDNPESIWSEAFEHQISEPAKALVLVLLSLGGSESLDRLAMTFEKYYLYLSNKYNFESSSMDFLNALRELDGSFISSEKNSGDTWISYQNPSVQDFAENYVIANPDHFLNLFHSATTFEQLYRLWNLRTEVEASYPLPLKSVREKYIKELFTHIQDEHFLNYESRLLFLGRAVKALYGNLDKWFQRIMTEIDDYSKQSFANVPALISLLGLIYREGRFSRLRPKLLSKLKRKIISNCYGFKEFEALVDASWLHRFFLDREWKELGFGFGTYIDQRFDEDLVDEDDSDNLKTFEIDLDRIASRFGYDPSARTIEIRNKIEKIEEKANSESSKWERDKQSVEEIGEDDDIAIKTLFATLG